MTALARYVRTSPSGPNVEVDDPRDDGVSVLDYLTGHNTLVEAINDAFADVRVEATEVYFPPGEYPIDAPITCSVAGKVIRFVPGSLLVLASSGLGKLVIDGAGVELSGNPVVRWNESSSVTYVAVDLHGVASKCGQIRFELNASVPNCTLLRLSGDLTEVGTVTYAGSGGSFKYGTDLCKQDGSSVFYARAGLQLWQLTDNGVQQNYTALLRYRSVRSQAGPISITNGARQFFVAILEVDGQHNSLLDPQINSGQGSTYGILLRDNSEFFAIYGGEIVGNYLAGSIGIRWGDGSIIAGTPAVGQGKLFDTKIRNWDYGCSITGSADSPMFSGCFIGNNKVADVLIDSQRGADVWPVSGLSFYGCYRESAAFPGLPIPFLLLRSGGLEGGEMSGCEIGAVGSSVVVESTMGTNKMQFNGNRFPMSGPTDAVTTPNTFSEFYFGLNAFSGTNAISKGAFAARATSFKDQIVTTSTISTLTLGAAGTPMTLRLASFGTANFAAGIPANDFVELPFTLPGSLSTDYFTWNLIGALPANPSLVFTCWMPSSGNVTLRARNVTGVAVGAIVGTVLFQVFRGLP